MTADTVADMLDAKEVELATKLAQARAQFTHAGNRGDAAESAFRGFLAGSRCLRAIASVEDRIPN